MARFRAADLVVESKPDLTPVTDADRAAEELVRMQLKRTRPRDSVEGEEFETTGHGPRRWVIDPIDGTKNFVRGVPVWATLIGLVVDNVPVLGLVAAPALQRRWWAANGSGAWTGRSLSSARPGTPRCAWPTTGSGRSRRLSRSWPTSDAAGPARRRGPAPGRCRRRGR